MSKDKLEQFIDTNREEFDIELPSLNLWDKIDKTVHPKPKKGSWQIATKAVAGLALFIIAGLLVYSNMDNSPKNINQAPIALISEENPEFSEIAEFYSSKINKNMSRLAAIGHHDPDIYREINQMESYFDTLKMDWTKNTHKSDEQLVNAMIENYRSRSMLLEDVVRRLERKNNNGTVARPALFKH